MSIPQEWFHWGYVDNSSLLGKQIMGSQHPKSWL